MGGCSAVNCTGSTRKGNKMYRFPADPKRRSQWVQNMRRDKWQPTTGNTLCEVHFERSQFELERADGWIKLKPNAVPTIFKVPNPPKPINTPRISIYKDPKYQVNKAEVDYTPIPGSSTENNYGLLLLENEKLREEKAGLILENLKLKEEIESLKRAVSSFLNDEQINVVQNGLSLFKKWSHDSVIKALKLRFALGVHGFEYLRRTNYPIPSYSTILRRVKDFPFKYGIIHGLRDPLSHKVASMDPKDRFCAMSIDEMEIDKRKDYEKNEKMFYGNVTLGDPNDEGTHIIVVLLRGLRTTWKQIISAEVSGKSTSALDLKRFVKEAIEFAESCGLKVLSLTSDMGPRNQALWTSLSVVIPKTGLRQNNFFMCEAPRYVIPDCLHLLKNLRGAVLRGPIILPEFLVEELSLDCNVVNGEYVRQLWNLEIDSRKELRLLHHLNRDDLYPDNFQSMNVGSAIRFFSVKTAAAIETAVCLNILAPSSLPTASFIRLIDDWLSIVNSKFRKSSVTVKNHEEKSKFLMKIINIFQQITFIQGWKPLNKGVIMASLSLIDCCNTLLDSGFSFVMLHRFSQDALENVFSQVRRRASKTPSALDCLRALKTICLSQFISDVKRTNYTDDNDHFLLDCLNPPKEVALPTEIHISHYRQATELDLEPLPVLNSHDFSNYDLNVLYFVAGSVTNAVSKKVCEECTIILNSFTIKYSNFKLFTELLNRGGLKSPCDKTMELLLKCEITFEKYKNYLLRNSGEELINKIVREVQVDFPNCCDLTKRVVQHFFTIRSYAVVGLSRSKKRRQIFGSSTQKRVKS